MLIANPFSVKTPETLTVGDIANLFIDVYSDFPKVLDSNHTFIHGSRGTGKSMMLRYLEPKVQLAANKVEKISELKFFAIHLPVKTATYNLSELDRLNGAQYWMLAEHYLITSICHSILLKVNDLVSSIEDRNELEFCILKILELMELFGFDINPERSSFEDLVKSFIKEKNNIKKYLTNISFTNESVIYSGALFDYEDFFINFSKEIAKLSFTPNGPLFLMLDDADNLNIRMQKILNGWVSYRSTNEVCLKISTQKKYKTWRTSQELLIESPHDFTEIDINSIYTSKQNGTYYQRIKKIVEKRLEFSGIKLSPEQFFPEDMLQKEKINVIKQNIAKDWNENIKRVSSRVSDDVGRYAVSMYMQELEQKKKSNLYSYAGFDSLVNISSGMIRYFLEPASRMYAEIQAQVVEDKSIDNIPSNIQDLIIKKWSEEFALLDFEKMRRDEVSSNNTNQRVEKLKNLINALGTCFRKKILSNDSERRFISFMLTSTPSNELQEILDLAIEWGYLSLSSISKKESGGRNNLYTLNRRLTPYFKLDPTGYAAHFSITPESLQIALINPNRFVSERLNDFSGSDIQQFTQTTLGF